MAEPTQSLRGLLLRRLSLPLLALMLVSAVGSFALARHYAQQVYDRWLFDSAMSLSQLIEVHDRTARMQVSPAASRMFSWDTVDQIHGEVVAADGARLYGAAAVPPPPLPGSVATDGADKQYYDAVMDGRAVRVVQVTLHPPGAAAPVVVRVAETLTKRTRLVHQLLLTSVPLQAALLVLAAWLAWSATGSAARHTNRAARRLAAARLEALAPLDPRQAAPRELWPAVHAFNSLVERLAAMQQAQQRFISNAAHQLRTPLAGMQIELESTLRETDPAAQRVALGGLLHGLTRLRHVTQQLLLLSRSEADSGAPLAVQPVDLAELARGVLERMTDRAVSQGVDLGYDGPDSGAIVAGEPQLLAEAISNLVDNALRYGARHGVVTVAVNIAADRIVLQVDDDGPGIPAAERERVVERFYRGNVGGDGCGLGLAIVNEIAGRHLAPLCIADAPGGGARVTLTFSR